MCTGLAACFECAALGAVVLLRVAAGSPGHRGRLRCAARARGTGAAQRAADDHRGGAARPRDALRAALRRLCRARLVRCNAIRVRAFAPTRDARSRRVAGIFGAAAIIAFARSAEPGCAMLIALHHRAHAGLLAEWMKPWQATGWVRPRARRKKPAPVPGAVFSAFSGFTPALRPNPRHSRTASRLHHLKLDR
jgi:hypothetical protein